MWVSCTLTLPDVEVIYYGFSAPDVRDGVGLVVSDVDVVHSPVYTRVHLSVVCQSN